MNNKTTYKLEVARLHQPFTPTSQVDNASPIMSIASDTPFTAFSVGDSMTDGPNIQFLGTVGHINHMIGAEGRDNFQTTRIYLNPIN